MSTSHQNMAEKSGQGRTRRLILRAIVFVLLILSSLPFVLPRIIDTDYIRTKAFELMGQELGQNIMADHIAITLFPRPGFRLGGVRFHADTHAFLGIQTALLFPDLNIFLSRTRRPLTGELVLKEITLLPSPAEDVSPLPSSLALIDTATLKNLALHFSYTSLHRYSLGIRGGYLDISLKTTPEQIISARSFQADIKKTPEIFTMDLDPMAFDAPAMVLGLGFHKDKHRSSLSISGDTVLIPPLRRMTSALLKNSGIATTLCHIIQGGRVPHITVDFQNDAEKFLFDPQKMVIKGKIKEGSIAIPATELVATDVTADVTVENGLLVPQISKAMVKGSRLNKGYLEVNLLDKGHPFNGDFSLTADLGRLPGVLQSLLPDTPLARELTLLKKTAGRANATLTLDRTPGHLDIGVQCSDIQVSGTYERFPGKTFQLKGKKVAFDKENIALNEFEGTIGASQISRVSGDISLVSPHDLDLRSAQGRFDVQDMLVWLSQFKTLSSFVTPLVSSRGTVRLDAFSLGGSLSRPGPWHYGAKGHFMEGSLYDTSEKRGISDIAFGFDISPKKLTVNDFTATLHDMALMAQKGPFSFLSPAQQAVLNDLHTPIVITDSSLHRKNRQVGLQANAVFPRGVSIKMMASTPTDSITLDSVEIKDGPLSNTTLTYHRGSALDVRGKLSLATIKKCFAPDTATSQKTTLPGSQGPVVVASGPEEQGLTLFIDNLDMGELLHALKTEDKKTATPDTDKKFDNLPRQKKTPPNNTREIQHKTPLDKDPGLSLIFHSRLMPRPLIIQVNSLKYGDFKISPLVLQVTPVKQGMDITIQESTLCGLPITGMVRQKNNTLKVRLETHAQKADLSTSLSCLMGKHHLIEGKYDLKASLSSSIDIPDTGPGGYPWVAFPEQSAQTPQMAEPSPGTAKDSPMTALISQCQGPFELYAREGRIFQMSLLSRILSLINVSSLLKGKLPDLVQQGFAYDTLIIKGEMKNGRINIQKGLINGVDMTLIITGWIDPLKRTMDLLIFISPLKSVDSLIQKLPIINTMFKGDLLSIPITAKGPLHDPVVMALSPVEITKGIINTLKDILTTPLTLLEKLP